MTLVKCARLFLLGVACLVAGDAWAAPPGRMPSQTARMRMAAQSESRLRADAIPPQDAPTPQEEVSTAPMPPVPDSLEPAQEWDGFSEATESCDECCTGGFFRRGMWYGSVDYLLMRPRLSQGVAEVRRTLVSDTINTPNTNTLTD